MSGKVIEFKKTASLPVSEAALAQVTGTIRCFGCKHEWQGVFEPGQIEFECPKCGTLKGRSKYECGPSDDEVYKCQCHNDLFVITRTGGPMCINCGLYHRPYDDPKGVA